jgi:hypothetical protein
MGFAACLHGQTCCTAQLIVKDIPHFHPPTFQPTLLSLKPDPNHCLVSSYPILAQCAVFVGASRDFRPAVLLHPQCSSPDERRGSLNDKKKADY